MRPTVLISALLLGLVVYLFGVPLCGCTTKTPAYLSAIKTNLKNLAIAEEAYWEEHRTYVDDLAALDFEPEAGVTVEVVSAGPESWWGRARHAAFAEGPYAGTDCVIGIGPQSGLAQTALKHRSGAEGEVVCDMRGWRATQNRWERWLWRFGD